MFQRTVFSVLAAMLAFAMTQCDFNPAAPFAGFDGETGATLRGEVQQNAAATAQRTVGSTYLAQRAVASASDGDALTVIVFDSEGNEIGSVDVEDGAFTLRGLPESFSLVFEDENGNPMGEPMEFYGVKPNQEIDIVVAVLDGAVVLVRERRTGIGHPGSGGVELEGAARNIVIDSPNDPMTGSLEVNGYHVFTRAAETSIRKGNRSLTLEDLDEGDKVHVRGVFEGEDVFAYEIKLQEEQEDEDDTTQQACNVPDPQKPNHILVCHKGRTLSISPDAWPGHQAHGDTCGPCP